MKTEATTRRPGPLPRTGAAQAGGAALGTRPTARRPRRRRNDAKYAVLLAGPLIVGLLAFYVWPIVRTFYFSFTEWGVFGGHSWTGLDNYRTILASPEMAHALRNTVVYASISLLAIPLGIAIAVLLNQPQLRGRTVYRVLYFLPVVTMPVAVGLLWRLMLNGDFGFVNAALRIVGIQGPAWLSDPATALIALGVVGIWAALGYDIILFLAGLQSIPEEVYEAAKLDGAGTACRFFRITLPLLSPTTFFVVVIQSINALQMFDLVYIMIGRNNPTIPDTQTVIYLFYKVAFIDNDKGLASAIVFLLLILIIGLTALQFRLQRRWVHYG